MLKDKFLPVLDKYAVSGWKVVAAGNTLLGESVNVAGLLPGRDIIRAAREKPGADVYLVPGQALNDDGLFLDEISLDDVKRELAPAKVMVSYSMAESVRQLAAMTD